MTGLPTEAPFQSKLYHPPSTVTAEARADVAIPTVTAIDATAMSVLIFITILSILFPSGNEFECTAGWNGPKGPENSNASSCAVGT